MTQKTKRKEQKTKSNIGRWLKKEELKPEKYTPENYEIERDDYVDVYSE